MKFKVTYIIFSIPSDDITNKEHTFSFTYEAELTQLGDLSHHVNEVLQKRFNKDNYNILSIEKVDE